PRAQRNSMATFWPSLKPLSLKPRRNAATRCAESSGDLALMNPITGMDACCPRAASGHATAVPPSSVMNWRLFTQSPRRRGNLLRLAFCGMHHFGLDRVIERNPCLLHLGSKRGTKLLLQAPNQRLTERSEMRRLYSEVRVLPACMTDDGLE